jgi:hypothetical protein
MLWVFASVPDPEWQPWSDDEEDGQSFTPSRIRDSFDTVIELIDINTGQLVSSAQFDEWLSPMCGSLFVYSFVETREGDSRAVISEVLLIEDGAAESDSNRG